MDLATAPVSTRQSGYTLIEILIVAGVLSIVMAIALANLANSLDKAKQRATMADMRTIAGAIEVYSVDTSRLPDDTGNFADLESVLEPYHTSVFPLRDHWGYSYRYSTDGAESYTVESFGKDGVDGADISVATRFEFERDIVLSNGQFVAAPQ